MAQALRNRRWFRYLLFKNLLLLVSVNQVLQEFVYLLVQANLKLMVKA